VTDTSTVPPGSPARTAKASHPGSPTVAVKVSVPSGPVRSAKSTTPVTSSSCSTRGSVPEVPDASKVTSPPGTARMK